MKILISVWHPAHVHFFKNIILGLQKSHEVLVLAREKEILIQLLEQMNISHKIVGKHAKAGIASKLFNIIPIIKQMLIFTNDFKPDIVVGLNDVYSGILGKLIRKKSIIFTDDDIWCINTALYHLFSDIIVTPETYQLKRKSEHYTFRGFKELAYLHPNYYKKTNSNSRGLNKVLFRLVDLKAAHDIGVQGLEYEKIINYINKYASYSKVIISSEDLSTRFPENEIFNSSDNIHDLLSRVSLLITDSQTMTTEAAVLGTPVIRVNSLKLSNFIILEKKYGLVYNIPDTEKALEFGISLLKRIEVVKEVHSKRRKKMLEDMIDVSQFSIDFINSYGS